MAIENARRTVGLKTKIRVKTNRRLKVDFFKSDMTNGHWSALFVKQFKHCSSWGVDQVCLFCLDYVTFAN